MCVGPFLCKLLFENYMIMLIQVLRPKHSCGIQLYKSLILLAIAFVEQGAWRKMYILHGYLCRSMQIFTEM